MTLVAGNLIRVKTFCMQPPQMGLIVQHMSVVSVAGDGGDEQLLVDTMANVIGTVVADLMSTTADYIGLSIQKVFPALGAEWWKRSVLAGTVAGDALPSQVSGILSFRTDVPGRRGRGRSYVPFPAEASNIAPNTPGGVYLANMALYRGVVVDHTYTNTNGGTCRLHLHVYHRTLNTSDPVTATSTPPKWATQRRRGSYGRPNVLPVPLQ